MIGRCTIAIGVLMLSESYKTKILKNHTIFQSLVLHDNIFIIPTYFFLVLHILITCKNLYKFCKSTKILVSLKIQNHYLMQDQQL